jgi:hypothetical protein
VLMPKEHGSDLLPWMAEVSPLPQILNTVHLLALPGTFPRVALPEPPPAGGRGTPLLGLHSRASCTVAQTKISKLGLAGGTPTDLRLIPPPRNCRRLHRRWRHNSTAVLSAQPALTLPPLLGGVNPPTSN